MRKIAYLFILLLTIGFVSCANDDNTIADDINNIAESGNGVYGTLAPVQPVQQGKLRSSMSYDYWTKTMNFSWVEGDKIGVFPYTEDNSSKQNTYSVSKVVNPLNAVFEPQDAAGLAIIKDNKYFSYYPVDETHDGGSNVVPVSFRDQAQENIVNMKDFYREGTDYEAYKASELEAGKHLPKYDFQISTAVSPEDESLHFQYTRLSSIVRLFLKVTDEITYDEIYVINKEANFVLDAQMNISATDAATAFTNPVTDHKVSLKLGKATTTVVDKKVTTTYEGFKVWDDTLTEEKCTLWSNRYNKAYIVLYMMFAPINLRDFVNSTLYLIGHDKNQNKQYYKATLSKINIAQNKVQQWAPAQMDDPDGAIEVTKAEVEEWLEDTNFDNEGTGTDDW